MLVTLDEEGKILADCDVEVWIDFKLQEKADIHVANFLSIDCLRSLLVKMKPADRPQIKWVFYGKEVHFDKDVRSLDAWSSSPLVDLQGKFLNELI